MTNIVINGIMGRMGHVLCDLIAQRTDCQVVAGIDAAANKIPEGKIGNIPVFANIADLNVQGDVLIDFSISFAVDGVLDYCENNGLPCVICTTGLSEETLNHIRTASQKVAVLRSANMSLGVNLLAELARQAISVLGNDYDIEIVEKHHHNKVDAPSGTAIMLADAINSQMNDQYHYVYDRQSVRAPRETSEIGICAVRGGSIVGDHDILFCGPDEVITLSHSAQSRTIFANGAIRSALFLAGQPAGLYTMNHVIQNDLNNL